MRIKGIDALQREISGAKRALEAMDGELGSVSFDPEDPSSIEAAIQQAETLIDERLGQYQNNPFVAPLIDGAKEQFRQAILDMAAEARVEDGNNEQ